MPGFIARKLCPQLRIIPPDFDKYREAASHVRKVFAKYDPDFSAASLDEAYLDLTDYMASMKTHPDAADTSSVRFSVPFFSQSIRVFVRDIGLLKLSTKRK